MLEISIILIFALLIIFSMPKMAPELESQSIKTSVLPFDWISIWSQFDDHSDEGIDVAIDSNDDIIMGGRTVTTSSNPFLAKYDETGVEVWNHTRNDGNTEWFRAIAISGTEIYACIDYNNISTMGKTGCNLRKFDGSGNNLWNKTWYTGPNPYTRDMAMSQAGEFYCMGEMAEGIYPSATYQYFILKLDSSGNEVWNVTFGIKDSSRKSLSGIATINDLVYVVGQNYSSRQPLLVSYNATTGSQLWNSTWIIPTQTEGQALDVVVDSVGNFYVTGHYGTYYGNRELFLRKYNSTMVLQWEKLYKNSSQGRGLALDDNSNIYVTGMTNENTGSDALLLKYAFNGTLLGIGSWKGNHSGYNFGNDVDVDSTGDVYIVGVTPGSVSWTDAFIIKNLELSLPGNGTPDGFIPGYDLWVMLGIISIAIIIIGKRRYKKI
jgi:hypothetical protein